MLARAGFTPVEWIAPQWIPIGLFFALLVAALATVGWMMQAVGAAPGPEPPLNGAFTAR